MVLGVTEMGFPSHCGALRSLKIIAVLSTFEYRPQALSILVISANLSTAIESSSLLSKSHVFQPSEDKTTVSDTRSF